MGKGFSVERKCPRCKVVKHWTKMCMPKTGQQTPTICKDCWRGELAELAVGTDMEPPNVDLLMQDLLKAVNRAHRKAKRKPKT